MIKKRILVFSFVIFIVVIVLPFAIFPLALYDNRTPSFWLGFFHNTVMPPIRGMDANNPYKVMWVRYSLWVCSLRETDCVISDGGE
ncbi:hypothetical protein DOQ73_23875 [Salmonella enterica subsp. enterica]|nr:hypothetical protein [Salmonella enterica subsp. enterica serovar Javiana]